MSRRKLILTLLSLSRVVFATPKQLSLHQELAEKELKITFLKQRNAACKKLQDQIVLQTEVNLAVEHHIEQLLNQARNTQREFKLMIAKHQLQLDEQSLKLALGQSMLALLHQFLAVIGGYYSKHDD